MMNSQKQNRAWQHATSWAVDIYRHARFTEKTDINMLHEAMDEMIDWLHRASGRSVSDLKTSLAGAHQSIKAGIMVGDDGEKHQNGILLAHIILEDVTARRIPFSERI